MIRLQYFPELWKVSKVIMIPKFGKPAHDKKSYRPISLLPTMSKIFEKVLLHRMLPILKERKIIPEHQFGFRKHHGTIEQVHRVCECIRKALENKEYCLSVFLDVEQAFDRVWHKGLLCKIKQSLPHTYYEILKSYLSDRLFYVSVDGHSSILHNAKAGVPQGSVLGPILYNLYTADLPITSGVTTATFADDTALLTNHRDPVIASKTLQDSLDKVYDWMQRWKMKASYTKSVQVTFTLRKGECPSINLGGCTLPQHQCVKYLGFHIDRRLTWSQHIKAKSKELSIRYKKLYWMLGRNSKLSLDNKLLIYKATLRPVCMYGIQLWGSACDSNINILQRQENKILRTIANAPWYITNSEIHEHLAITTIKEEINNAARAYKQRLCNHPNTLARQLTLQNYVSRLNRFKILDLEERT